jgi:excisionase family DNA binding protein
MGDPQRLEDVMAGERMLLLTPEEAAEVLRIGRTTVYALMKAGELHAVHIGRSCRISRRELERYVRRLEAPEPVPRRSPGRKRTNTDQGGLFELTSDPVDKPHAQ